MHIIRKSISLLLSIAMLFNSVAPIVAYAKTTQTETITNYSQPDFESKGNIELETHLVLPLINHQKSGITISIKDKDNTASISLDEAAKDGYLEDNIKLGAQTIRVVATKRNNNGGLLGEDEALVYLNINFYSLNKGEYTLTLSGKHFVTYSVDVKLDDYSKRVSLTDENGMFALGDLNSDNKVDNLDLNEILTAMATNDTTKDLNLDGKVDIADLNYITANTTSTAKTPKIEDTSAILSSTDIKVELDTNNIVGDINNIFTDDGMVTLKPTETEEPIHLALDFDPQKNINMSEIRLAVGENKPTKMEVVVETIDGEEIKLKDKSIVYPNTEFETFTDKANEDTIVINLGKQVAVKKVTITINETTSNEKLADIAKVEFLNNVKVETTKPDKFYTPQNIKVDSSKSEQLTVSFDTVPNVTGYEIQITGPEKNGVVFQTTFNTFTIEDLKNYQTYKISVQSVNEEWRSGWSDPVEGIPTATRKPPMVDMVVATPGYGSIDFSWKSMDDTKSYNLYYSEANTKNWQKIPNIEGAKYTLLGLKSGVEYEAYVTGNNDLGEGTGSAIVKATTLESTATIYPKYRLINEYDATLNRTTHIKEVRYNRGNSYLTNNNNDRTLSDKWSMVDDNYLSYWEFEDWQINASGGYNFGNPIFILDQPYKMDEFVITVPNGFPNTYKTGTYDESSDSRNDTKLFYWDNPDEITDQTKKEVKGVLTQKKDKNNQPYYVFKLKDPIETSVVQFGLTVVGNKTPIDIAEVKFYQYDSLVDDVAALFTDELRLTLAPGVDQNKINELRARADEEHNGELNPYRDIILSDLEYAEKILKDEKLDDVIELNPDISNYYNNHLGFAMTISDYQPLGVAAKEGEQIAIYVGSTGKVNAQIVYTQYHAEANAWQTTSKNLVKGQNIFTIPKIGSSSTERGGSLYIRYTSTPDAKNPIRVRVSGGTKIPVLDISKLSDENAKKAEITNYITELKAYNSKLPSLYAANNQTFDAKNSVLGSTEIVTKYGLWSVSSIAAEAALKEDAVSQLYETTAAFDEMMDMFYRQKGLSADTTTSTDRLPKARINIRYMQMFDGAFMYAGGYHVGIEYGSIGGLFTASRATPTKTGYFGWGISHEIGHQINQSSLVHAEVTNNIYALLAQTSNDYDHSRLETSNIYEKIYDKVTSHTLGKAQNVFVTLGMYWQLHLAYDYSENVTATNTFNDPNSIYARINKLTRSAKLSGYSKDDLLYIYASEAAGKDLLEFFTDWGLNPTHAAQNYVKEQHLEPETRKISYLNDAARRYKIKGETSMSSDTRITSDNLTPSVDNLKKEVTLSFKVNQDSEKILGYEILRNGTSIAFVTNTNNDVLTYVDHVGSENNRAYTYQVIAYDYLLNKTEPTEFNEIKISYDGSLASKDTFSIESNFKQKEDIIDPENDTLDYKKLSINNLIDNESTTSFNGIERIKSLSINGNNVNSTTNNETPYIIINLNAKYALTGIKYQALVENGLLNANTIKKYNVYVSADKENWSLAKTGEFTLNEANNYTDTIYFMKPGTTSENQLWTYNDISYVKIEAVGNQNGISGSEIDIIAPPGDNIDIGLTEDNTPTIGILDKDYVYDAETNEVIKAGSVIITGDYRGEPAFNIITISDASDIKKRFSGYQLFFAEVNDDKTVYEVLKGTWMYILTKEEYENMRANSNGIRANLYRVNDAYNNTGERLTSTSKKIANLPAYEDLQSMSINND